MDPRPQPYLSFQVINTNRKTFRKLVQVIIGHNFLTIYSALVDNTNENKGRLRMENEETSFHITAKCLALSRARQLCLGLITQSKPVLWSKRQIVSFPREAPIDYLFDHDR